MAGLVYAEEREFRYGLISYNERTNTEVVFCLFFKYVQVRGRAFAGFFDGSYASRNMVFYQYGDDDHRIGDLIFSRSYL